MNRAKALLKCKELLLFHGKNHNLRPFQCSKLTKNLQMAVVAGVAGQNALAMHLKTELFYFQQVSRTYTDAHEIWKVGAWDPSLLDHTAKPTGSDIFSILCPFLVIYSPCF